MTSPAPQSGFPLGRVVLLALVAALLAAVIWFGAGILALRAKVAATESERDLAKTAQQLAEAQLKERTLVAEGMINDLNRQLHARPDLSPWKAIELAAVDGGAAHAMFFWDPQSKLGAFVGQHLEAGYIYHLWLTDRKTGAPVFLGTVHPLADGSAMTTFHPGATGELSQNLDVSLEIGASLTPEHGRPVLRGK